MAERWLPLFEQTRARVTKTLGAGNNIIVIDVVESKNVKTFTYVEFFKIWEIGQP